MKTVGFVGLGIMGKSMAENLMKKGFPVGGYARHPEKVQDLKEKGMVLYDSLPEMVQNSGIVISMVGFPADVKEIYFGKDGILENAKPGTFLIDMTTSSPSLAKEIAAAGKEKGLQVLDAPVTGGDAGAKAGTLTILAGGSWEDFEALQPVFEAMGTNIRYMGENGSGQDAKLVNQILIAGAMAGLAEAWSYVKEKGMDPQLIYEALNQGAAASRSLDLYWPRLCRDDKNPGFFVKHFIKDMNLALDESSHKLPILEAVSKEYEEVDPELGTQALVDFYQ